MATPAPSPIPEGMNSVTAHLWFNGNCREAIDVYQKVFGATLAGPIMENPKGDGIWHAVLAIGNSRIMLADAMPDVWERGPENMATMGIWLYVPDCDEVLQRAAGEKFTVLMPLHDSFWGDRFGKVKDPFGHPWAVATKKWEYTPEEMAERQAKLDI